MATKIFPSTNDVAPVTGGGKVMTETNLKTWVGNNYAVNLVISNLTASAGSGLNLNVAAGNAMISGQWVNKDAQESVTLTDNATNYVFLKLTLDGSNNVTGAVLEANTTGTPPADSVKIAQVVTSGGTIQQVTDYRDWAVTMKKTSSGGISAVDRSGVETALARLAASETITGNWTFAPAVGPTWFNADGASKGISLKGRAGAENEGAITFYQNNGTTLEGQIYGSNSKGLVLVGPSGTDDLIIGSGGLITMTSTWNTVLQLKSTDAQGPVLKFLDPSGNPTIGALSTYSAITGVGTDLTPTLFAETGLGVSFAVNGSPTKVMQIDSAGRAYFANSMMVGSTVVAPDTSLHVFRGDSGGSSTVDSVLTLEDSTDVSINILTSNTKFGVIRFGDPQSNTVGGIWYNHNTNTLGFITNDTGVVSINSSGQLVSTLATGTAPFSVASTTMVNNLNVQSHGGYGVSDGGTAGGVPVNNGTLMSTLNADMVDGRHVSNTQGGLPLSDTNIQTYLNAGYVKDYEPGNASQKLAINNGTVNTNLNADMLDGSHASAFAAASHNQADSTITIDTVSGYKGGITTYVKGDSQFGTAFDVYGNMLISTFEGVGPTGSGALNTWATLDAVPSTAQALIVTIYGQSASDQNYKTYARQYNGSTSVAESNIIGAGEGIGATVAFIPVDSSRRFDVAWGGVSVTAVKLYLTGWIE